MMNEERAGYSHSQRLDLPLWLHELPCGLWSKEEVRELLFERAKAETTTERDYINKHALLALQTEKDAVIVNAKKLDREETPGSLTLRVGEDRFGDH